MEQNWAEIIRILLASFSILLVIFVYYSLLKYLVKPGSQKIWFAAGIFVLFSFTVFVSPKLYLTSQTLQKYHITATELLWWLALYYLIYQIIQHWIWDRLYQNKGTSFSRIFRDTISVLILLVILTAITYFVFHKSVFGIFTVSGFIGLILAYSAKNYLGDIFAGFELNMAGEFMVGDWIKVTDNNNREYLGKVVEMNWHFVKLISKESNYISVANSVISRYPIINLSKPTTIRSILLTVPLSGATSPAQFKKTLINAALQCDHVIKKPKPTAALLRSEAESNLYQLNYLTNEIDETRINDHILSVLFYSCRRKKIKLFDNDKSDPEIPSPTQLKSFFKDLHLFSMLNTAELDLLSTNAIAHHYGPPERLLEQGQQNSSLYIVYNGSLRVVLKKGARHLQLANLGSGTYFGEMSLLIGEPCNASVFVVEESIVVEINHSTLAKLFAQKPALVEGITAEILKRKQHNEELKAALPEEDAHETTLMERLIHQVKVFFHAE